MGENIILHVLVGLKRRKYNTRLNEDQGGI